jgi:hemoglobin/transferrin/lactoferrin receptor protein
MLRMHPLALAAASVASFLVFPAHAQSGATAPTTAEPTRLEEITVSATRSARKVNQVPNTVSVITRKNLDEKIAHNLKDMLEDELDLSVRQATSRFSVASGTGRGGVEGINIRGLEGNQVLMMSDGIRLPNAFSFVSFSTGRGDYIETEGLKSAEVLRGPASTQFGSDGLAGAVSLRTIDPADLLKDGKTTAGYARSSYNGVDSSWGNTIAAATQAGRLQALILASHRKGHEVENKGQDHSQNANRTASNPNDYSSNYVLGKLAFGINDKHRIGATIESQRRKQDTEVYSARSVPPLAASSVIDFDTRDKLRRDRISFDHHYQDLNAPWVQKIDTSIYWQDAENRQFSAEDRNTAADRTRDNTFASSVAGISSVLQSSFASASAQHRLTYGVDWSRSKIEGLRDGTTPTMGDPLPSKPFPNTTYTQTGAFAQDEIELGKFSIIPGLRFDHYDLKPSAAGYTGTLVSLSDQALTPKIGLIWRASPAFAPYAQWAKGFRAPTPDQVNNSFSNPIHGYGSIGNPNLKPERANSLEVGFRGRHENLRYSLAAFDNRYDNFISQQVVSVNPGPPPFITYQYINLAEARIKGLEARGEWTLSPSWTANAGFAYSEGDSRSNGVKSTLETINPFKAVIGARYEAGPWGFKANITHSSAKSPTLLPRLQTSGAPGAPTLPQFAPPSYTVLDLGMSWKQANWSLNANLNNVFDQKYWRWSDARGVADNAQRDAYSAPRRNLSVSLRYDF